MKADVESISPVKKKLSVQVSPEEIVAEEQTALRELRGRVSIPGFRKGKAPLAAVKRQYGGRVRSDVITRLIEKTYYETLQKQEIYPVNDADIQLQEGAEDGGFSYTAVLEVRPTVVADAYKGLTLTKERVSLDETEAESQLEKLRHEHASYELADADHPAEDGDMVVMDYEGSVDGELFEGGAGQDRELVLGSGMFIPGFEDGLLGTRANEERTVEVSFPEDYRAEELAGKAASFKVKVKEVKLRRLPDLDDEFAKEAAQVDTLEELRSRVRERLREEKQQHSDREFRQTTVDSLLSAHPFEVPESMISSQQTHSVERLRRDLAMRGLNPEALGMDEAKMHEAHRRGAERAVRWAFLMRAVADAETIEVTDEDLEARIAEIAESDGRPISTIRAFFETEDRMDGLRSSMLERKVLDRVAELGTVNEVDAVAGESEADDE